MESTANPEDVLQLSNIIDSLENFINYSRQVYTIKPMGL
jgi:hypothetical protein